MGLGVTSVIVVFHLFRLLLDSQLKNTLAQRFMCVVGERISPTNLLQNKEYTVLYTPYTGQVKTYVSRHAKVYVCECVFNNFSFKR